MLKSSIKICLELFLLKYENYDLSFDVCERFKSYIYEQLENAPSDYDELYHYILNNSFYLPVATFEVVRDFLFYMHKLLYVDKK